MIKRKQLDIQIVFKTYLKVLNKDKNILDFPTDFCSAKHNSFKNCSKKLFWRIVINQVLRILFCRNYNSILCYVMIFTDDRNYIYNFQS